MPPVKTSRPRKRTRTRRTRLAGAVPRLGDGTREKILAGAREVLLRHGYERFTTRRVAESAGITVGNLTYHFPSKRQLLASLIQRLLAEYTSAFESFFADLSIPMDRKFK